MMTVSRIHCGICGKTGEEVYRGLRDRLFGAAGVYGERRCRACGILWLDPQPSEDELAACYGEYFTHADLSDSDLSWSGRSRSRLKQAAREAILCGKFGYHAIHAQHGLCLAGKILAAIPAIYYPATFGLGDLFPRYHAGGVRVVDVGCGRGDAIRAMRSYGIDVLGVEPDPAAADALARTGVPCVNKTLEEAHCAPFSADQVSLLHVLEHLPDPAATLAACYAILKKGGRITIRTPNHTGLGHRIFKRDWLHLDPPRHLQLFSARALRAVLGTCGFRQIRIVSQPRGSSYAYDASSTLRHQATLRHAHPRPHPGRSIFACACYLLSACGLMAGDELEAVAYK